MSFSLESECNNKTIILDLEVSKDNDKSKTAVHSKPTFSSIYTYFDSVPSATINLGWFTPSRKML